MSKLLMIIKADTNDADYVTRESWVEEKTLEEIKEIWKVVKKQKDHNWCVGEISRPEERPEFMYEGKLTSSQIDFFDSFRPYGEYGIHTIESIIIHEVVKTIQL